MDETVAEIFMGYLVAMILKVPKWLNGCCSFVEETGRLATDAFF